MARPVKRRSYDTAARRASSDATRRRIIDAARELFIERGYHTTTVAMISTRAEVNVDSVYQLVGRKPVLLRELIEEALSGTDRAVVAEQRSHVLAMRAEPDPARKLAIYARAIRQTQQRMAPLFLALRDAAGVDPEARAVWHEISERRATNMRKLVRELGGLRAGLTIAQAADVVWATNSSELYVMMTVDRGWSPLRFERWLADTWCRLLLP
jgi:AcrR family transcriptional regulator